MTIAEDYIDRNTARMYAEGLDGSPLPCQMGIQMNPRIKRNKAATEYRCVKDWQLPPPGAPVNFHVGGGVEKLPLMEAVSKCKRMKAGECWKVKTP